MPLVLVISSYVAGSRVGGGIAPYVLAPLKVDPVHVPTTLFGRHPGWGRPGGEAVAAATMEDMLEAIRANGLFAMTDAILTGYFVTPGQVELAARAIDAVRAARGPAAAPLVIVDPVIGDTGSGMFVSRDTARAQADYLLPRAGLIACNHWEFAWLTDLAGDTGPDIRPDIRNVADRALASGRNWLVSSLTHGARMANLLVWDGAAHGAAHDRLEGPTPKGAGDLFHLAFLGACLTGAGPRQALHRAVGAVTGVLQRAAASGAAELPLAACHDLLARSEEGGAHIDL